MDSIYLNTSVLFYNKSLQVMIYCTHLIFLLVQRCTHVLFAIKYGLGGHLGGHLGGQNREILYIK